MRGVAAAAPRRWLPAMIFGAASGLSWQAQAAGSEADAVAWLARADNAARSISYAGTYVNANGERTSTYRITHVVADGQEQERIEPLDGPKLEIIRRNEEMLCYYPEAKTVRLDRRISARFFPGVFRAAPEMLSESYVASVGADERVLGHECRWIHLEPKQPASRFSQRVCVEKGTGLVLRAKSMNASGQVVSQQTFTDLRIGQSVARSEAKSIFEPRIKTWTRDAQPREESRPYDSGLEAAPPAGFRKVAEVRRTFPGRPEPVTQLFYTDGIASVSVFVEPNDAPPKGASEHQEGVTAVVVNPGPAALPRMRVTVVGELPLEAARKVATSVRSAR